MSEITLINKTNDKSVKNCSIYNLFYSTLSNVSSLGIYEIKIIIKIADNISDVKKITYLYQFDDGRLNCNQLKTKNMNDTFATSSFLPP